MALACRLFVYFALSIRAAENSEAASDADDMTVVAAILSALLYGRHDCVPWSK